MQIKPKDKVVLTDKGNMLRKELEKELIFDFPTIRTSHTTSHSHIPKFTESDIFKTTNLLPKAGYFGPKPKHPPVQKGEYKLYPNYLKRDPREYPPVHVCAFQETPRIKGRHELPVQIPKLSHIHHTLYNSEFREKLLKDPSAKRINSTVYNGPVVVPMNICVSAYPDPSELAATEPDQPETSRTIYTQKNATMYNTLSKSIAWTTSRSQSASRFATVDPKKSFVKAERLIEKHISNEKKFEETLLSIDQKVREKMSKFEENQNEIEEFFDKMKEGDKDIKEIDVLKKNEEIRHTRRIKEFQIKKYEGYWRLHVTPRLRGEKDGVEQSQDTIHTSNMALKGNSEIGDNGSHHSEILPQIHKNYERMRTRTESKGSDSFFKTLSKTASIVQ